jgi:hypothetical protein
MLPEEKILEAAENVENLLTIDFRGRGMIGKLVNMVRDIYHIPPSLIAARKMMESSQPGSFVFVVTGLNARGVIAETDGPVGAAFLGRSLAIGLKIRPIFLINQEFRTIMSQTARGAGLNVFDLDEFHRFKDKIIACSSVLDFPLKDGAAKSEAKRLLDEFSPIAIIAVEARGMNKLGICHTWDGENVSHSEPKFNWLFSEANSRGIFTVGIVDGCCTEIGYAPIREQLIQHFNFLSNCRCGCGGGIADDTAVDIILPAAVSNWGAYAIGACLSLLVGDEKVLHSRDLEIRAIRECADAGAIEGVSGIPIPAVDDLPAEFHGEIVEFLRTLVRNHLKGFEGGHEALRSQK